MRSKLMGLGLALLAFKAVAGNLCQSGETVLFSCEVVKPAGKILSLCGAPKDASPYVQYRFGKSDKVELEYPTERKGSTKNFSYSHYGRFRTDYFSVKFQNKAIRYDVNSGFADDGGEKIDSAGISIQIPGKKKIVFDCQKPVEGTLFNLEKLVPNTEYTGR